MFRKNAFAALLLVAVLACSESPGGIEVPPVSRVEVGPANRVLTVGDTMRLTAYPTASDGTVLGSVAISWVSEDADVAGVTNLGIHGVVQAKAPGSVLISATAEGRTGSVRVTVTAAPLQVASVEITPSVLSLQPGQEHPVEAVLRAADGTVIGGRAITWSSSSAPTVTATSYGNVSFAMLRAHTVGNAAITATSEGVSGTAHVTVGMLPATPVAHVHIQPFTKSVWVDHIVAFTGVALASNGTVLNGRTITWSIEDSTIAAVNAATGQVRGRRPGVTKVRATSEGVTAQATLHVFPIPAGWLTYELTYDWWDGQVRVAEPMGPVAWTDSAGVERTAELSLMRGSLVIDYDFYPYSYTRILIGEAWAVVDGALRKVAERQFEDRGAIEMVSAPDGMPRMQFVSVVTPGLLYQARPRGHGELEVRTEVGGRTVDVLFRQRP